MAAALTRAALVAVGVAAALVAMPARAQQWRAEGARDGGNPRVVVELIAGARSVAPGSRVEVGVRFRLDPGWHVYWHNPGEAAMATDIELRAPGASVSEIAWPAPRRFEEAGFIVTYGYADEVVLPAELTVASDASGTLAIEAVADFLVCETECIPDRLTVRRALPIAAATEVDADAARELAEWRARAPVAAEAAGAEIEVRLTPPAIAPGTRFRADIEVICLGCGLEPPPGGGAHAFFPARIEGVTVRSREVRVEPRGNVATIVAEGTATRDRPRARRRLRGVVVLARADDGPLHLAIDAPLPATDTDTVMATVTATATATDTDTAAASALPLWQVLLFALLGGLLLNLMPCVLPVLAIKAFGLIRHAGESRRARTLHAAAYTGGILASFLALAAVVLALRAGGTQLGWGFQLQEPLFVAALAAVLVVFAMRLFGVIGINVGATALAERVDAAGGHARSFGEGVLAVVVATPCTAPFLGSAVGFALASDAPVIVGVFLAVGVGLALPFVLLVLVPGAERLLPRPGAWMVRLEVVLGFALLLTVVWLAWLIGRVAGTDGMARLLLFVIAVALATWIAGTWALRLDAPRRARVLATIAAVVLAGSAGWATLRFEPAPAAPAATRGWSAWSPEAVDGALADGRIVFVDFTADWCISCKANESLVLERGEVARALGAEDVVAMRADWTRRDERIRRELARHGRAGVPLYLVHAPGDSAPEVLPEVITSGLVLEALARARSRIQSSPLSRRTR